MIMISKSDLFKIRNCLLAYEVIMERNLKKALNLNLDITSFNILKNRLQRAINEATESIKRVEEMIKEIN